MTKLSGKVAILNEQGEVIEIRDLGPDPVEVKAGRVKQIEETRADLSEGERHAAPVYSVEGDKVVAAYGKEAIPPAPPSLEDRVAALEEAVAELRK